MQLDKKIIIEIPENGGYQVRVTDKKTDITVIMTSKKFITQGSLLDDDLEVIFTKMLDIRNEFERFNGDQLLYPIEVE